MDQKFYVTMNWCNLDYDSHGWFGGNLFFWHKRTNRNDFSEFVFQVYCSEFAKYENVTFSRFIFQNGPVTVADVYCSKCSDVRRLSNPLIVLNTLLYLVHKKIRCSFRGGGSVIQHTKFIFLFLSTVWKVIGEIFRVSLVANYNCTSAYCSLWVVLLFLQPLTSKIH